MSRGSSAILPIMRPTMTHVALHVRDLDATLTFYGDFSDGSGGYDGDGAGGGPWDSDDDFGDDDDLGDIDDFDDDLDDLDD